jgi:hypothetical protein
MPSCSAAVANRSFRARVICATTPGSSPSTTSHDGFTGLKVPSINSETSGTTVSSTFSPGFALASALEDLGRLTIEELNTLGKCD